MIPSYASPLNDSVDAVINTDLSGSSFSLFVYDSGEEKPIYRYNINKRLLPASNTKLFTAVAALLALNKDYHYKTDLGFDPHALKKNILTNNLYFKFRGDPDFKINDLEKMIQFLKRKSIHEIQGDIILDLSYFEAPHQPLGLSYDDLGWYYAAKTPALIINENAFRVYFKANKNLKGPLKITPIDKTFGVKIITNAITVSPKEAEQECDLDIYHDNKNKIYISGCWPYDKIKKIERLAVPDPVEWFKQILKNKLHQSGIIFSGEIQVGRWPKNFLASYQHLSPSLLMLIQHMLYESDNVYADSLLKTLGKIYRDHGNYKSGVLAIKTILKQGMGFNIDSIELHDGQGTRYNQITTNTLVNLLKAVYKKPELRILFMKTLPLSGIRGTLHDRMNDLNLKGKVYAKTGSMHDVSSLAGYIQKPSGDMFIFAMITNNYQGKIALLHSVEENLLRIVLKNKKETDSK